jgi:hypothetical protein
MALVDVKRLNGGGCNRRYFDGAGRSEELRISRTSRLKLRKSSEFVAAAFAWQREAVNRSKETDSRTFHCVLGPREHQISNCPETMHFTHRGR